MVNFTWVFCSNPAGNDNNPAALFHPFDKLVAVITLICKYELAVQVKRLQQFFGDTNIISIPAGKDKTQRVSKPIRHRMDFRAQSSPAAPCFLAMKPFFDRRIRADVL